MSTKADSLLQPEQAPIAINYNDEALAESVEQEQSIAEGEVYFEFDIGPITLMVKHEIHCEYLQSPKISSLPLMPAWMTGLVNIRGALVPVFHLHQMLGFETNRDAQQATIRVLVMDRSEDAGALLIDSPPRVVRHTDDAWTDPVNAPAQLRGIVTHAVNSNGRECYVVHHRELFESLFNIQLNRQSVNG